jgi:hypothetical protein
VEVDLINPADGNCGVNCSNNSSLQVEISNLGGSPVDVFVDVRSLHLETVFTGSQNHNSCCLGLPVPDNHTESICIDIKQDTPPNNNSGKDSLVLEIAYRDQPAKLNSKQEFGSLPSNSTVSGQLESKIDLIDP